MGVPTPQCLKTQPSKPAVCSGRRTGRHRASTVSAPQKESEREVIRAEWLAWAAEGARLSL